VLINSRWGGVTQSGAMGICHLDAVLAHFLGKYSSKVYFMLTPR
jgi:hypothetical protein